jgi:thiol-disulfide isomerase/thioredoxin
MKVIIIGLALISLLFAACSHGDNHSGLTTEDSEKLYSWSQAMFGRLYDPKLNGADSNKWKVYAVMAKNLMPENHFPPFIKRYTDKLKDNDSSFFARVNQLTSIYGNNWPRHYMDTFYHEIPEAEFDEKLLTGGFDVFPWLDTNFIYPKSSAAFEGFLMKHPRNAPTLIENTDYDYPSLTDINGKIWEKANLSNKVVIINYWFIGCMPCREEMPELNKLVNLYKSNPAVVFLGVAPDSKENLIKALKKFEFAYNIIPDSGPLLDSLHLDGFPSHEVIGRDGKIAFSCTESGQRAIRWLKKTIENCLAKR